MVPTSFSAFPAQNFIFMLRTNQLKFKLQQHILGFFQTWSTPRKNNLLKSLVFLDFLRFLQRACSNDFVAKGIVDLLFYIELVTHVIRICRIKVSIEPGWRRVDEIYRRKFISNYMGEVQK
jgi:hypothetical protein